MLTIKNTTLDFTNNDVSADLNKLFNRINNSLSDNIICVVTTTVTIHTIQYTVDIPLFSVAQPNTHNPACNSLYESVVLTNFNT